MVRHYLHQAAVEACGDLSTPRGFEAQFICLLGGRLGRRAEEIAHYHTSYLDWNRNSSASHSTNRVTVDTASDRPVRKPPAPTSSPKPTLSRPAGTPRPSPQPVRFLLISHCESNSVSSGLRIATMACRGRGQRSTDVSRTPPTKQLSRDVSLRTVWGYRGQPPCVQGRGPGTAASTDGLE